MAKSWQTVYTAWVTHYATNPDWPMLRILHVERRDGAPVRCGWDTLQQIKNVVLGPDTMAVEVFPRHEDLVDETNRRHFWEVPSEWPVGFHWRAQ